MLDDLFYDSILVTSEPQTEEESEVELPSNPLFIQFDSLRQVEPISNNSSSTSAAAAPIVIHRPSILKIILMQSNVNSSESNQEMSLISLSGIVLRKRRNNWELKEGSQFHDPNTVVVGNENNLEKYQLPGGIIALYNSTSSCWYVLPASSLSPSPVNTTRTISTTDNTGKSQMLPEIGSKFDV